MLLGEETPRQLAFSPAELGSWGLEPRSAAVDCRSAASVGDVWARLAAGGDHNHLQSGGFSHESEHDLAAMVSDFLENGSGGGAEARYSSDSDSGFPDLGHLSDIVQSCKRTVDQYERDLLLVVHSLLLSISEKDLHTVHDGQCNASCIRNSLVKLLRFSGYDAAVCFSKWQGIGKVPGGDHEFVDVVANDSVGRSQRLIIDIDFHSHFEIARAVASYDAILNSLPVVYVSYLPRLKQFLQVMADAAKCSLKQNSMPIPPWRSLSYLQAKWHSKCERIYSTGRQKIHSGSSDHKRCIGHLRQLKASLQSEIEKERLFKSITNDRKRRAKYDRLRPSVLRS